MDSDSTSLDDIFADQPAAAEPEQTSAEPAPTPEPQEPIDKGEPATPPVAQTIEPEPEHVPRKALMEERRKRQEYEGRVQEAARHNAELARQNAEMQQYLQHLAAQQQQAQQRQQPQIQQPQAIVLDQFDNYEQYLEALADAKAEAKVMQKFRELEQSAAERSQRQQQQQQQEQQQRYQQEQHRRIAEELAPMVMAGRAAYADFDDVVSRSPAYGGPTITDPMRDVMAALDGGHEVAYYLGNNAAESARIAGLSAASQVRELTKIAKQLSVPPVVPPTPVAPQIPKTLTQTRSAGGQYTKPWTGQTPLDEVVRKK